MNPATLAQSIVESLREGNFGDLSNAPIDWDYLEAYLGKELRKHLTCNPTLVRQALGHLEVWFSKLSPLDKLSSEGLVAETTIDLLKRALRK
jgi:hypothetical protein